VTLAVADGLIAGAAVCDLPAPAEGFTGSRGRRATLVDHNIKAITRWLLTMVVQASNPVIVLMSQNPIDTELI
jgi:hypothetical protein